MCIYQCFFFFEIEKIATLHTKQAINQFDAALIPTWQPECVFSDRATTIAIKRALELVSVSFFLCMCVCFFSVGARVTEEAAQVTASSSINFDILLS